MKLVELCDDLNRRDLVCKLERSIDLSYGDRISRKVRSTESRTVRSSDFRTPEGGQIKIWGGVEGCIFNF